MSGAAFVFVRVVFPRSERCGGASAAEERAPRRTSSERGGEEVASAAEKKPSLKEVVAQLDASIPKDERNINGPKETHFPKIAFEGSQGQGKKVVFTVPLENLSPPDFDSIEYMWIKDANDGTILTARKFRPSEPDYTITAFGSSGQKLTAASKDDKFGIWEGTFVVP